MKSHYLTKEELEKLKKELNRLKTVERKKIARRIKHAASFGDLKENSEYQEAKEAQAFLEGKILELDNLLKSAVVIKKSTDKVQVGSIVLVESNGVKQEFEIVGSIIEADPLKGKISADSPIGEALINLKKGDIFEVETPGGKIKYKILEIK